MLGGVTGAYLLTSIDGDVLKPVISAYLLIMGVIILIKAFNSNHEHTDEVKQVGLLGLVGGFFDAVGGGGWGPIVTSTLIGQGTTPRFAIGTVNLAEFFVTFTISATFVFTIGLELWPIIAGLIIGGVIAAPFSAYATKRLPDDILMIIVGLVVAILSLRGILNGFA